MRGRQKVALALALVVASVVATSAVVMQRIQFGGTGADTSGDANGYYMRANAGSTALEASPYNAPGATGATGDICGAVVSPIVLTGNDLSCPTCMVPDSTSTTSAIVGGSTAGTAIVTTNFRWRLNTAASGIQTSYPTFVNGGWLRNLTFGTDGTFTANAGVWPTFYLTISPQSAFEGEVSVGNPYVVSSDSPKVTDTKNKARVEPYDFVFAGSGAAVGHSATYTGYSGEFVSDTGVAMLAATFESTVPNKSAKRYSAPFLPAKVSTTAVDVAFPFPGTLKNLCVITTTSNGGTQLLQTVRVNGSATSLVANIGANAGTGVFCDTTNTASVTDHQTVGFEFLFTPNSGTSASIFGWSMEYLPTSGTAGIIGGDLTGTAASGTQYWPPWGKTAGSTVAPLNVPMPRAGTSTDLCITFSGAVASGETFTLMKNGSASTLVVTTTTQAAASVQCASGSVSFAQTDTLALKSVYTSGNANWLSWTVDY